MSVSGNNWIKEVYSLILVNNTRTQICVLSKKTSLQIQFGFFYSDHS